MATTQTSQSHYAGKEAGKILGKAFKEARTIASGFVTVNEGVNYKLYLRKVNTTGGRRRYTCGFEPAGEVNLTDKALEPIKFKDDFEVCKETFRNQWNEGDLGDSAWNDGDMKPIMDAIVADKLAREAEELETNLWQGDKTNTDEFDGYLTQFEGDDEVITVTGTDVDEDNAVAEISKAIKAIPAKLRKKPLKLGVASNVMTAYSLVLIGKGIVNGLGGDANTGLKFGKWIVEELPGLPDNNMVIADSENLVFGTGLKGDHNEIKVVDSDAVNLDGKFKGTMVYNAGTGYYYGDEIVWYRPETPSV